LNNRKKWRKENKDKWNLKQKPRVSFMEWNLRMDLEEP
jgi:hypothetical protein